jgi:Rrf2 family nitric oxide-sensitive transcriptional repressor
MRLSEFTDYTWRELMHRAAHRNRLVTIGELAEHHGLSKHHLMKVVSDLARQDVMRATETDVRLVECFGATTNACTPTPSCRLKHLVNDALAGCFKALDGATLADLTQGLEGRSATTVQSNRSQAGRKMPAVVAAPIARRAVRPGRSA